MKVRDVAEAYAADHGLSFVPKGALASAPTLGLGQVGVNLITGAIAGGPPGILFQRVTMRGPFLPSAQYEIAALGAAVGGLWVRRSGRSIWTRVGLPRGYTELMLPSDAFNARYRVGIHSQLDEAVARRLLSNDFLDWLTDFVSPGSPVDVGTTFEIWQGVLFIRGPLDAFKSPDKLDKFAGAAARIATEVAGLTKSPDPGRPSASHAWACDLCGTSAGSIELGEHGDVRRDSFTSALTRGLADAAAGELRAALAAGDAAAVHALDPELAPWWCPECRKSYCGGHWLRWDVFDDEDPSWHDSIRGRCPEGHERMLED